MKRVTLSVRQMEQLLANQQNRSLSSRWLVYYREMMDGRFSFDIAPIILYRDGTLADGQHRLRAAIEAGLPRTWYVAEIERDEIVRVDAGRPRTVRDHTVILGAPVHNTLLSAARMALMLESPEHWSARTIFSHSEVLAAVDRYGLRDWPGVGPFRGWAQFVGVCCYVAAHVPGDRPKEFAERVRDGTMMSQDDARLTLRSRLMHKHNTTTGSSSQQQYLWCCIRAWNAYYSGEPLRKLIVPTPLTTIRPITRDQA